MNRTARGFAVFTEFVDTYGATVTVQKSSSAGVRRCWVSARGGRTLGSRQLELSKESPEQPGHMIVNDNTTAHLTPAQARRLATALLRFADGAE